jgi:hypothetical protein
MDFCELQRSPEKVNQTFNYERALSRVLYEELNNLFSEAKTLNKTDKFW